MGRTGKMVWQWGGAGAALALLWGCSGGAAPADPPGGDGEGEVDTDPVLEGHDFGYESLDLSTVGAQSANWCKLPEFTPEGFLPLDKERLATLLAEYTVGWMTPVHESIGTLREQSLFNSSFELVWASFHRDCNWNTEEDLTFGDDGLLDEQNRADAYQEVFDFIQGGVEVASGEVLRLALHECADCNEPLGAAPFYVNAKLSTDGVLSLEVEPFEGAPSQTYLLTPEVVVARVELAPFSEWLKQVDSAARAGDVSWPYAGGTLTAIALRTETGTWASMGVSGLSFDSQLESPDNIHFQATTSCIGMHATTHFPSAAAETSAYLGDLQAAVPGSLHCQSPDCGAAETTEDWIYAVNNFSLEAEQPEATSDEEILVRMGADNSAAARLGAETFAEWRVGSELAEDNQPFSASVAEQAEGFLVTFEPALNMRGAMVISKFSDQFRLSLPTWLEDEIFDINFGGDPSASVFVPYRQPCGDELDNPSEMEPVVSERREVEIVSGTLRAEVGSGLKTAVVGECVGASLLPESEMTLTSDWVEFGFVCQ